MSLTPEEERVRDEATSRTAAAKKAVLTSVFNMKDQEKAVQQAAVESAADQRDLLERYQQATAQ